MDISTHALTWSATRYITEVIIDEAFQLTRSRGARLDYMDFPETEEDFNSRAHVERDSFSVRDTSGTLDFNSRAHVERDSRRCKRR